jgi:hypothetical protein
MDTYDSFLVMRGFHRRPVGTDLMDGYSRGSTLLYYFGGAYRLAYESDEYGPQDVLLFASARDLFVAIALSISGH